MLRVLMEQGFGAQHRTNLLWHLSFGVQVYSLKQGWIQNAHKNTV